MKRVIALEHPPIRLNQPDRKANAPANKPGAFAGRPNVSIWSANALGALALLAGCVSTPVPVVHKTGSTFAERQTVADQCRIESLEKIPQALVTEYRPPEYSPGFTECREDPVSGRRYCRETGGFFYPGSSRTRDVNAELRERYIGGCLHRSGFEVIAKPICGGDAETAYLAGRDNQAPAASLACVTDDERLIPRGWR